MAVNDGNTGNEAQASSELKTPSHFLGIDIGTTTIIVPEIIRARADPENDKAIQS